VPLQDTFPSASSPTTLTGYVDAAYDTDSMNRRSSLIDTDENFDDDIAVVQAKGVSAVVCMTHTVQAKSERRDQCRFGRLGQDPAHW
jgi:hypothetical protein